LRRQHRNGLVALAPVTSSNGLSWSATQGIFSGSDPLMKLRVLGVVTACCSLQPQLRPELAVARLSTVKVH